MPKAARRSAKPVVARAQFRSAVSNGTRLFLDDVDGRQLIARRYRDLTGLLLSDMGGADAVSEGELILVKRIATLVLHCESIEAAMANGRKVNFDTYLPAVNTLRRLLETVGLKRKAKVINGSPLDAYASTPSPARKRVRVARTIDAPTRRVDARVAAVAGGPK